MKIIILAVVCLLTVAVASRATVASNTVEIVYNGTTATVTVAANISDYITDKSDGSSHVKLIQSASVNDAIGEISYILSGTSDDGEFYLEGNYKTTIELNGLTLTNPSGPAINIQDGKRIKVKVNEGTTNTLTDGVNKNYNGCLHIKGHSEFRGKGTLNVTGNSKHGIYSKEYIQLKNTVINISGAVKDAIHCKEYFLMESGTINITKAGDDGIQVELDDEADKTGATSEHEDENSGNFYQTGGILNFSGYNGKAVKADGIITFKGGARNFSTSETEDATGIEEMRNGENEIMRNEIYDLQGRRVNSQFSILNSQLHNGLYIFKNGNTTVKRFVK